MLAPLMEIEGSRPSLKDPRHLNGPARAAKMEGANIGSMGDGNPLEGSQEPQNQCLILPGISNFRHICLAQCC